jgi:hypothetical protein
VLYLVICLKFLFNFSGKCLNLGWDGLIKNKSGKRGFERFKLVKAEV